MPILESKGMRAIFQNKGKEKGKMFENLDKNVLWKFKVWKYF